MVNPFFTSARDISGPRVIQSGAYSPLLFPEVKGQTILTCTLSFKRYSLPVTKHTANLTDMHLFKWYSMLTKRQERIIVR